jgi:hypothetical protein
MRDPEGAEECRDRARETAIELRDASHRQPGLHRHDVGA